jgi:hypothetical protein
MARTVKCHYCWNKGHNVKTCVKLTEEVKANLGGYYHRKFSKYFDEQGNRKQDNKVRACSYCADLGHTKRNCNVRLQDIVHNIDINSKYRKKVHAWFHEKQLGIGSLVDIYNGLYLVTGINWENFVCGRKGHAEKHILIQPVDGKSYYTDFTIDDWAIKTNDDLIKVISGSDNIPYPPKQWWEGKSEMYLDYNGRVVDRL